ncbi:MAG: anti-sigma factor family protein [Candidatus Aminicenantia bacterium]
MNCSQAINLLSEYLDNQLDRSIKNEIAEHLKGCSSCSEELKTLKKTLKILKSLDILEPPKKSEEEK